MVCKVFLYCAFSIVYPRRSACDPPPSSTNLEYGEDDFGHVAARQPHQKHRAEVCAQLVHARHEASNQARDAAREWKVKICLNLILHAAKATSSTGHLAKKGCCTAVKCGAKGDGRSWVL